MMGQISENMTAYSILHAPIVTVLPATKPSIQNATQLKKQINIRVAAYCRVSTRDESQQTSYTGQISFYTKLINQNSNWILAGIYADLDATGTNTDRRSGFKTMIEEAKKGNIDYIITKSISRFARNTVDTLNHVRMLRQLHPVVGVYFEKENVDTLDTSSELLLTILSALAQDESRSISDNVRWSYAKKFQAGVAHCNLTRMLGYDKGADGEWMINEEQAKIVRLIYRMYLSGKSACGIARELNRQKITTVVGKRWGASSIMCILRNEKYVGDCELQKTIVKDFLTHYSYRNRGEAPKYYVKNHHDPIIERDAWNQVQAIIARLGGTRRKKDGNEHTNAGGAREIPVKGQTFYNLYCEEGMEGHACGERFCRATYSRKIKNYRDERSLYAEKDDSGVDATDRMEEAYKYTFPVWRCRGKYGEGKGCRIIQVNQKCKAAMLYEIALEQSFMEMLYGIKRDYERNGENSGIVYSYEESRERVQHTQGNYMRFMECLKNLSDTNAAGMRFVVRGVDVLQEMDETVERADQAADLLPFDRGMYTAFVEKAVLRGDQVEYQTNFGVRLTSSGNSRTLGHFLGYRQCTGEKVHVIVNAWEASGSKIQYRRRAKDDR